MASRHGRRGTPAKSADDLLSLKIKEKARKEIERQEELDDLKHQAEKAELLKKAKESEVKTDNAGGFQVKGSLNLGDFNIMEERRKAEEMVGQVQQKFDDEKRILENRTVAAEKAVTEMRYESLLQKVQDMNKELLDKIKQYNEGANNKNDILSLFKQIDEAEPLLVKLGYAKAAAAGASSDMALQIQLRKMDIDSQREDREFQWKMRQDEREHERMVARDDRELRIQEQGLADKREAAKANRSMFSDGLEAFGRAVGQGMRDAPVGGEEEAPIQEKPPGASGQPRRQQAPPKGGANPPPSTTKGYHIEAGVGDSGVLDCPECQQPVTLGADTEEAVCANCETHIRVVRVENARKDTQ